MTALELRVPPVALTVLTGVAMWACAEVLPPLNVPLPRMLRIGIGVLLGTVGLAFALAAVIAFHRARTTVNPLRPGKSTALVTGGVYARSRNPMYVGLLAVLAAWTVWLANIGALLLVFLFVLYMTRFQIVPEERALAAHFGTSFEDYRRSVRRWF